MKAIRTSLALSALLSIIGPALAAEGTPPGIFFPSDVRAAIDAKLAKDSVKTSSLGLDLDQDFKGGARFYIDAPCSDPDFSGNKELFNVRECDWFSYGSFNQDFEKKLKFARALEQAGLATVQKGIFKHQRNGKTWDFGCYMVTLSDALARLGEHPAPGITYQSKPFEYFKIASNQVQSVTSLRHKDQDKGEGQCIIAKVVIGLAPIPPFTKELVEALPKNEGFSRIEFSSSEQNVTVCRNGDKWEAR